MADFSILDQANVLQVLFHPRQVDKPLPPGVYTVQVQVESNITLSGRLYPVSHQEEEIQKDTPIILLFHGNGEIAADYDYFSHFFTDLGITLLVMDYRSYGVSQGSPTVSNLLRDAVKVFEEMKSIFQTFGYNYNPLQLYIMGRSLGSAAAIEVAKYAGDKIAGLIIESGFANTFPLLTRLGVKLETDDEYQYGIGNGVKISRITTPTLIIHGQEDSLIPVEQAQELYSASAADHKRLVIIPEVGHNTVMMLGRKQYFKAIQTFMES
jgi:alpha-beta hydrolase superfamily lysophospholipase